MCIRDRFGLPPAGRALLYAALQKDLGRVLCIVTPGEAEATHFADDLKALGLAAAMFPPRDFMLRPDVYKRQGWPCAAVFVCRCIFFAYNVYLFARAYVIPVSYTHLDVYKRQVIRLEL